VADKEKGVYASTSYVLKGETIKGFSSRFSFEGREEKEGGRG